MRGLDGVEVVVMRIFIDAPGTVMAANLASVVDHRARNPFGRMVMGHMLADTEEELHQMAARIGLKRAWYQSEARTPHYDVSLSKRAEAIRHGAKEVGRSELVAIIRAKREAASDRA